MPRSDLRRRLANKEYRDSLVGAFVSSTIAYQIRLLRKKLGWDQKRLGIVADMKQAAISRLENPDYGNVSLTTLKRLASAFDVALVVRFVPFSEFVRVRGEMRRADYAPASYGEDKVLRDSRTEDTFSGSTAGSHRLTVVNVPSMQRSLPFNADTGSGLALAIDNTGRMNPNHKMRSA